MLIKQKYDFFKRHTAYDFFLYNESLDIVTNFKHWSKSMHRLFSIFSIYEFNLKQKCKLFYSWVSSILNYFTLLKFGVIIKHQA